QRQVGAGQGDLVGGPREAGAGHGQGDEPDLIGDPGTGRGGQHQPERREQEVDRATDQAGAGGQCGVGTGVGEGVGLGVAWAAAAAAAAHWPGCGSPVSLMKISSYFWSPGVAAGASEPSALHTLSVTIPAGLLQAAGQALCE